MPGRTIQDPSAHKFIDVVGGKAKYVHTEVEDSRGRWNDDYNVSDGYYVMHYGDKHHVYYFNINDPDPTEGDLYDRL